MDIGKLFSQAWGLFLKDVGPLVVGALIAGIIPAIAATIVFVATLGMTFATSTISAEGGVTSVSGAGWALLGIGTALVVVVSVLLSAPLYAGLVAGVIRRVRLGRAMGYGDAFLGFSFFGPVVGATALISLVMLAIIAVPAVLAIAAAVASSTLLAIAAALTGMLAVAAALFFYTRWVYVMPLIVDRGEGVAGSLGRSGAMVARTGWWVTFLALILMTIVIGVVSGVLGVIPFVGAVASLLLTPYMLAYVTVMYFQAGDEGVLVDTLLVRTPQTPLQQSAADTRYHQPSSAQAAVPAPPAAQSWAPGAEASPSPGLETPLGPMPETPPAASPEPLSWSAPEQSARQPSSYDGASPQPPYADAPPGVAQAEAAGQLQPEPPAEPESPESPRGDRQ